MRICSSRPFAIVSRHSVTAVFRSHLFNQLTQPIVPKDTHTNVCLSIRDNSNCNLEGLLGTLRDYLLHSPIFSFIPTVISLLIVVIPTQYLL